MSSPPEQERTPPRREGSPPKQSLAVWKFASCDGCQLSLLDCEDELLLLGERLEISYFLEASSSTALITIGACATAGGIQALRNFADVEEFASIVYASPEYVSTLDTSTPISAHVPVDFELNGCPINKHQ